MMDDFSEFTHISTQNTTTYNEGCKIQCSYWYAWRLDWFDNRSKLSAKKHKTMNTRPTTTRIVHSAKVSGSLHSFHIHSFSRTFLFARCKTVGGQAWFHHTSIGKVVQARHPIKVHALKSLEQRSDCPSGESRSAKQYLSCPLFDLLHANHYGWKIELPQEHFFGAQLFSFSVPTIFHRLCAVWKPEQNVAISVSRWCRQQHSTLSCELLVSRTRERTTLKLRQQVNTRA